MRSFLLRVSVEVNAGSGHQPGAIDAVRTPPYLVVAEANKSNPGHGRILTDVLLIFRRVEPVLQLFSRLTNLAFEWYTIVLCKLYL